MNARVDISSEFVDPDDLDNNRSANPHFENVLAAGLQRRSVLRGGVGGAMAAMFAPLALTACGGDDDVVTANPVTPPVAAPVEILLGFTAVARTLADTSTVPGGYTATTIFATGDPLAAGVPAYKNDGTDTNYAQRSGDCHDGMEYFGLSATGTRNDTSNDRALLGINHEYITPVVLHVAGPTRADPALPLSLANGRPASQVDIEIDCHGVAIVEIAKTAGKFATVQASTFNRRITGDTPIEISGPARGNPLLVTKFSPDGTRTRGTINNCGTGKTPWGTLLTGEENWSGYYFRPAGDQALRPAKENTSFARYGRNVTATANANSRYGWETAGTDDRYAHWNIGVLGATAADDYRYEHNGQGYMTEIDPYSPTSTINKRTALGRFAHESAAFGKAVVGKPLAVYMGCDSQNEYIYKWVSAASWSAADGAAADRMAVGDKYLDNGKLYAAVFNDDGTGEWRELSIGNPVVASYANYAFADAGDVAINARLAADAVGATKMDRPEWCGVHPTTGEVYFALTNNSSRRVAPTGTQTRVNASNPRAYSDVRSGTVVQSGNVHGHILRMKDAGGEPGATTFTWDIYLFGAEAGSDPTLVNLSGLSNDNDFSSPDGLVFSQSTGICWVQTDDGAYTDVTNCMMVAAMPGTLGDGGVKTLNYGSVSVQTPVGKVPEGSKLKRFFVGPYDCEVTGMCETPDGKVMFINVQHPGDGTAAADLADASKYTSQWPSNVGYGAGKRPRSATVMITKNDNGRVGS
ncbi:MAG: PhoX family phosphatase [Rubrivivax sp.]|nr:PhoX family phosphatase [Rubrivivax sp.]